MIARFISIDDQKRGLPGYHPTRAEEFHTASAKQADALFAKALKEERCPSAILLCGGSASGKTEFASEYLDEADAVVYDGTLSSVHGAEVKLRKIRNVNKKPVVIGILPDDLERAFDAFLHRERQFSDEHFYRTHVGARKTLLWIAENAPDVEVQLYESTYRNGPSLTFDLLEFKTRPQLVAHLQKIQYTEAQLIALITAI